MIYICKKDYPIGIITMFSDGTYLTGLYIENQKYYPSELKVEMVENVKELEIFHNVDIWLESYFSGIIPQNKIPLMFNGTSFREEVWNILLKIPYGELTTYGEIAKVIEKKNNKKVSAQAVGGAVGHNPISIIVPCHRVVGSDGSLTGYAGGIDKKIKLLEIENVPIEKLYIPKKGTAL